MSPLFSSESPGILVVDDEPDLVEIIKQALEPEGFRVFTQTNPTAALKFYEEHWRFFETDERQIEYPGYPIQGRWKVDAIGLPDGVLKKLYSGNAQQLIPGLKT